MKVRVGIVDYGIGNVLSVKNAIEYLGYRCDIASDERILKKCDFLILPGVGAFSIGMQKLNNLNLDSILSEMVMIDKKPILGICLGMQMMADVSNEKGINKGLGWIPGEVIKIEAKSNLKVPHVGWNQIHCKDNALFNRINNSPNVYFDHSYHFVSVSKEHISATVVYGDELVAAINKDNIWGVQFHPEKSQVNGLRIFKSVIDEVT